MIYTLGHKLSYDIGIKSRGSDFKKLGVRANHRGHPYPGGSVWQTEQEVRKYIERNQSRLKLYDVYGILADWEHDTEQVAGEPFRRLLVDSTIVALG